MENERKLASIQKILKIEPIDGADMIEKATVLGWSVVVRKGEFKEGDFVVYCEVDSFLPVTPEFEFLRKSSYKKMEDKEGFRLKTCKLRGQISQGLILPLTILPERLCYDLEGNKVGDAYEYGEDVTETLGIVKWELPISAKMRGEVMGSFPSFIPKTDETRIQSAPEVLDELKGLPYYITEKADGTSMTAYYKSEEENGVCSRNLELKENDSVVYWQVTKKYHILEALKELQELCGDSFALQMEIVAPGIQKNPMGLKEAEVRVFNLYNMSQKRYENYDRLAIFCFENNIPMVGLIERGEAFNYTLEDLIEKAKGKYNSGKEREGIVIRPAKETYSCSLKGRLSFKVLNNNFLLKED